MLTPCRKVIIQVPLCCFKTLLPLQSQAWFKNWGFVGASSGGSFSNCDTSWAKTRFFFWAFVGASSGGWFSNVDTLSARRSIHPPLFLKVLQKYHSHAGKSFQLFWKLIFKNKNNQKSTVISISKLHVKSEGKSLMIFHRFLWFAIRPQREAEFTPLIFIKFEYRKNGHLLKRYKNNINWYVSIIAVGWCLDPMPCNALKTNRKSI